MFMQNLLFGGKARCELPIAEAHMSQLCNETNYNLSGQCVPAMVAQWAIEPRRKDVHSFI